MAWTSLRTWVTGEFVLSASQERALALLREQLLADDPRIVVLEGSSGAGKTVVASYFAQYNHGFFSGGATAVDARGDITAAAAGELRSGGPSLVVIDEAHRAVALQARVRELRRVLPESRIIVISQDAIEYGELPADARIGVAQLLSGELRSLSGLDVTQIETQRLAKWLDDRPLTPRTLIQALDEGVLSQRNVAPGVELYSAAVILGPDGRPASADQTHRAEIEVRAASERLFELVHESPDLIRALTPREFEEVVAEYFHRQGYEVELTASSRDGGKDVYAAKTDALGSFLYIVECKAFSPTNPVGVRFVRHLYGVVQHERATAGVLATTSHFTHGAKAFQQDVQFQLSLRDFGDVKQWLAAAQ
jgi:restriction system protein